MDQLTSQLVDYQMKVIEAWQHLHSGPRKAIVEWHRGSPLYYRNWRKALMSRVRKYKGIHKIKLKDWLKGMIESELQTKAIMSQLIGSEYRAAFQSFQFSTDGRYTILLGSMARRAGLDATGNTTVSKEK